MILVYPNQLIYRYAKIPRRLQVKFDARGVDELEAACAELLPLPKGLLVFDDDSALKEFKLDGSAILCARVLPFANQT
jgi:hypothetical protein